MHRAYAKINLGLHVLRRRADGYHDIETVFHRVDLFDEISLEPAPAISVSCTEPGVPSNEENICFKAALLLQRRFGLRRGVRITLRKAIPVGGGLGGGSSDAAVVLRELPPLWGIALDESSARAVALELGSDVAYFLGRGSALGSGRGDLLSYFRLEIPHAILLCNPGIHLSTAWAYRQLRVDPGRRRPDLRIALRDGMADPALLRERLQNDFEPAVFAAYPEVSRLRETMLEAGALFASMSGSGSSVYGFFADAEGAAELAARLRQRGYGAWVTAPFFNPV